MMSQRVPWIAALVLSVAAMAGMPPAAAAQTPAIRFDHNHTYAEVVAYLQGVVKAVPNIVELRTIGKSFLGKDLLVLEITNKATGAPLEKPGYWIDGNLHASEVFGAEVCLKTIDTLVSQYGKDPAITKLVDTRTIYVMPKLNPDGSDHFLTKPDSMRSSVRPWDDDDDYVNDEDPGEDLNGDGYLTQIRVKDPVGRYRTSTQDPRLVVARREDEPGEWTVYSEGIDNDNDGKFNEDGVGGLDINRNWPSQWQQNYIQNGGGPYPLSEPETRAVAEFLLSHPNVTGIINHHMAGNFLYRPPLQRQFNPVTGQEEGLAPEDDEIYTLFGKKYSEFINNQKVQAVYGRGEPPTMGAIWGVFIGWGQDHYGVFSFVPEMGAFPADYNKDGDVSDVERLRWNDTDMGGRVFMPWKPFNHPQLGQVEIGGFIGKLYNPTTKTYTNLMCTPEDGFGDFLTKHTKWNLYLASMAPEVRITNVTVTPGEAGYFKVTASIQNQGYLPTNVTQQAVKTQTARTVKATIAVTGGSVSLGSPSIDLGHLPGNTPQSGSPVKKVEWMVKTSGPTPASVVIKAVSEKGGTDTKTVSTSAKPAAR